MKNLKKITLALTLALAVGLSQSTHAKDSAQYFRVWQGFKKVELSYPQFISELPLFMRDTVDIYRDRVLNNYLVIVPPENKPDFIPDELALVALTSKQGYQEIRASDEGLRYAERHWDVFEKGVSKSADPMVDYSKDKPKSLLHNQSYDIIGKPIDWTRGYNAVFIGIRKSGLSSDSYLARLKTHIDLAKTVMLPKGLRGYIVIANENYEIAYLNWSSKKAHDQAGQSDGGKKVFSDAGTIMDILMYQEAVPFEAGLEVSPNHAYSTIQ
ncbi:MAG: hypothetical protein SGJ18_11470 [Pseudomonadota bacterium]|nr:hypothetical protein [Pseudomonadota bacterium]